MSQDDTDKEQGHRDFFISYTSSDRQWAEWIAMQLDQAGYTLFIQAWDFRPGSNFVAEMDNAAKRAERTVLVLSPAYLESDFAFAEWATAFRSDPRGIHRRLLPVRIQQVEVGGLLGPVVFIDLVQLEEEEARERLLAGIQQDRVKPTIVAFPGDYTSLPSVAFPGSLPSIWNVPYPRNPFFTGREQMLEDLHRHLANTASAALTQSPAITGLGGIGKTQVAIEYANRYRDEYHFVLWVNAASLETLIEGFVSIARLVDLPVKNEPDQHLIVEAVKQWFVNNGHWLLIIDNADDLRLTSDFLPTAGKGHLLLTTRVSATGSIAQSFPVEKMSEDEGVLLLLRRAKILTTAEPSLVQVSLTDHTTAITIVKELDGFPLALNQAGAYIEETPSTLATYLTIYRHRHMELLKQDGNDPYHHVPIASTWSLNFAQVEQRDPTAADLLRLLAFLAPDAIPEDLIVAGAGELGPQLAMLATDETLLDEPIRTLTRFSLVQRNPSTHLVAIHRLVQVVFQARMAEETRRQWAERTVRAVNKALPKIELATLPQYERYQPHALACAALIDAYTFTFPEATRLLNQTAAYSDEHDHFQQAEALYQRALSIREAVLGPNHPDTAWSLDGLATNYKIQERYSEAEPLYQRALSIREAVLGPDHPDTASSLNLLGNLYTDLGWYSEAEDFYKRALDIREAVSGPDHPDTAVILNNLSGLYARVGWYLRAKPLIERVISIYKAALGPDSRGARLAEQNYENLLNTMEWLEDTEYFDV